MNHISTCVHMRHNVLRTCACSNAAWHLTRYLLQLVKSSIPCCINQHLMHCVEKMHELTVYIPSAAGFNPKFSIEFEFISLCRPSSVFYRSHNWSLMHALHGLSIDKRTALARFRSIARISRNYVIPSSLGKTIDLNFRDFNDFSDFRFKDGQFLARLPGVVSLYT